MSDSLFRLSLKAFIQNDKGEVLVVKETGRDWWDLPGGGMEYHDETIKQALARELKEEVRYDGDFTYEVAAVDEPHELLRGVTQVRLVYVVIPDNYDFSCGVDGDELSFEDPERFANSEAGAERLVCYYARKLRGGVAYNPYMPIRETKKGLR